MHLCFSLSLSSSCLACRHFGSSLSAQFLLPPLLHFECFRSLRSLGSFLNSLHLKFCVRRANHRTSKCTTPVKPVSKMQVESRTERHTSSPTHHCLDRH